MTVRAAGVARAHQRGQTLIDVRARIRAVPVQPHVPRRGHRIPLRVVGTRAGRRAAGAQSGADSVDPRYLYAETGSCPRRDRARCRSSTSARRIVRERSTRSSARASRPAISRRRFPVTPANPLVLKTADDPQVPDGTVVRQRRMPRLRGGLARGAAPDPVPGVSRRRSRCAAPATPRRWSAPTSRRRRAPGSRGCPRRRRAERSTSRRR